MNVGYNSKVYFICILQTLFHVAPVPPKEFQHCETALETLTCGWDFKKKSLIVEIIYILAMSCSEVVFSLI